MSISQSRRSRSGAASSGGGSAWPKTRTDTLAKSAKAVADKCGVFAAALLYSRLHRPLISLASSAPLPRSSLPLPSRFSIVFAAFLRLPAVPLTAARTDPREPFSAQREGSFTYRSVILSDRKRKIFISKVSILYNNYFQNSYVPTTL